MAQDQEPAVEAEKKKSKRMPDAVVMQRVGVIYQLLRNGQRKTSEILRIVAKAQANEIADRKKFANDAAKLATVPIVWGENALPQRTLQYYLHKAKLQLEEEGRAVPKQGDFILGIQMARINDLYQRALTAGKLATCARLIEETNAMFGIRGTVHLHLSTDQTASSSEEVPEAELTEAQAMDEFTRFRQLIEERQADKLRRAEPAEIEMKQLGAG